MTLNVKHRATIWIIFGHPLKQNNILQKKNKAENAKHIPHTHIAMSSRQ
jgi:hypothetical protein